MPVLFITSPWKQSLSGGIVLKFLMTDTTVFKYPVDFPASIPSNVTENIKILIKVRFMILVYEKLNRFDLFKINVFKINTNAVLHWTSSKFRWAASKIFSIFFSAISTRW